MIRVLIILSIIFQAFAVNAEILFSDGFESGDRATVGPYGAKWRTMGTNVSVSTSSPRTGSYSLKLIYKADPGDLNGDANAEATFSLGQGYDEVYIRFYVKYPSSYYLRDTPSSENTKLMYIWGSDYQHDGNITGLEYLQNLYAKFKMAINSSGLTCDGNSGFYNGLTGSGVNLASKLGQWTAVEFRVKRDTGSGNGAVQVWQDGVLVQSGTNLSWVGAPCGISEFFRDGYLLGWSNSGYETDQTVYIDDVVFSTSYIGLAGTSGTGPTITNPYPSSSTVLPYGTTQVMETFSTNVNATCRKSSTSGVAYTSMSSITSTGGTTHSNLVTGLTNGSSTPMYYRCTDGTTENPYDYTITAIVASAGCEQDASKCTNATDCSTYWPNLYWNVAETPPCSTVFPDTTCSSGSFYQCYTEADCTDVGLYWYDDICNTIPQPTDITGNNLLTGGDFTVANALDEWEQFSSPDISLASNGLGLRLTGSGQIAQDPGFIVGKTYRFLANISSISGFLKQWNYNQSDQLFSSVGTITGVTSWDPDGDMRIFFGSHTDTSDIIVNNIRLFERSDTAPCSVDSLIGCNQLECEALVPTHYYWSSECHDTPRPSGAILYRTGGSISYGGTGTIQ